MNQAQEQEIQKLKQSLGQLNKIETIMEDYLTDDEFFELADATGTVAAYIKVGIRRINKNIEID